MIVPKGSISVPVASSQLKLLQRVEVWDSVYGERGNRKICNLVPMHPEHFAECKANKAFEDGAVGQPKYFTRTPHGLMLHQATDKDYWFEPFFRKPVPVRAGRLNDSGELSAT